MSTSPKISRPQLERPVRQVRIDPEKPFSVHIVSVGKPPRTSQPRHGKRAPFFLHSDVIVPNIIQAWQPIGCKLTFVCDRAALDAIDNYYEQQWRQAFINTKTIFDRVHDDGGHIDADRIRGILVEHLSPLDRGHLTFCLNLNMTLREALLIERKRWTTLANMAKTLHSPHMPSDLRLKIEEQASRAMLEIQGNVECCKKADRVIKKEANQFLRYERNAGVRKLITPLTGLLMRTGSQRAKAAELAHELIKAWAPDVSASTPESIRIRSIKKKLL